MRLLGIGHEIAVLESIIIDYAWYHIPTNAAQVHGINLVQLL